MALFIKKAVLETRWQPCVQILRFRNRINIQRPREPHYERAKVLYVCRPFFPKPERAALPMVDLCLKPIEVAKKKDEVENPYQILVAREMLSWFNNSRMILFFHENPMKAEAYHKARILYKKQNMCFRKYTRLIAISALEGTKYETVLDLFNSPVTMVFSSEPQVSKAIKINKKIPELILIGGIIEDRLLSKKEVIEYSKLPDLQTARAQVVATLNAAAFHLVHSLNQHQLTLVGHLQQHIELQSPKDATESKTEVTEDSQASETKVDSQPPKDETKS